MTVKVRIPAGKTCSKCGKVHFVTTDDTKLVLGSELSDGFWMNCDCRGTGLVHLENVDKTDLLDAMAEYNAAI